jgi:hypothetical protein
MKHEELTGQILGAAMTVLNEFKPGLDGKLHNPSEDRKSNHGFPG